MKTENLTSGHVLVTGNDIDGVKRAALTLFNEMKEGIDDMNIEIIDGASENADEMLEAIRQTTSAVTTYPFLGDEKVVWLKNATCFGAKPWTKDEKLEQSLTEFVALMTTNTVKVKLLLSASGLDKRKTISKLLAKIFTVKTADLPEFGMFNTEENIRTWVMDRSSKSGVKVSPEACALLAARVGGNPGQLASELEKLQTACPSGEIGEIAVRALVPTTKNSNIFELSDAIRRRNARFAVEIIKRLMEQGESGVAILLVAIVPAIRGLLVASELRSQGVQGGTSRDLEARIRNASEMTVEMIPKKADGSMNVFSIHQSMSGCSNYTTSELIRAIQKIAEASEALISGGGDEVIQKLVIDIIG